MNCPACKSRTVEQGFDGLRGARILLDVCPTCHGLWFDARESLQLSSHGVLRLFRQMHGRKDQHYRLKESLSCPRCRAALARTHDVARGNRYQYFRCPDGHGHFITFFQFLREKGIVRGLTLKEREELKKHVQRIQCSDCGDPISLARETACPRCHAPVCILDPKALGETLEGVKPAVAAAGAVVAPAVAAQLLMDKMGMDGFYRKLDTRALAASTASTAPPLESSGAASSSSAERALDVVDAAEVGVDLIDLGIDFFFDVSGGIGDLF